LALVLVGVLNSFCFDWLLRQKAAAHVSIYILAELPMPDLASDTERFIAHGSLRLCCNHRGFARLWGEQFGGAWREAAPRRSWPAIADEPEREQIRAAMDAVIAYGYGLDHAQFERVLAGFTHRSHPDAAARRLAAFDELASQGLQGFCHARDPYADIPLVTERARPVINLVATRDLPVGAVAGV
jgi:hypothetical protein